MSSIPVKHHRPIEIQGRKYGVARCRVNFDDAEVDLAAASAVVTWAEAVTNHGTGAHAPPANSNIVDAWLIRVTDFVGGAISAITVSLGDAGNDDELLAASNIFTGAKAAAAITTQDGVYTKGTFESAYTPIITITATGANLDALTAGAFELCIAYEEISADPRVLG